MRFHVPSTTALALLGLGLLAGTAHGKTLRTIAIDGNVSDWADVLLDRDQKVADRSALQGDPDMPPQAQRDLRGVAFTWDATNLYIFFSRTGAGTNSFSGVFYMDLNHDGFMSAADRVAVFRFSGSSFGGFEYDRYNDGGTPDPLGGDGVSMPGSLGTTVTTAGANAAVDTNGIALEASVSWATLGVPAGTPMFIQSSLAASLNLPTGIQDNADRLDTFLVGVLLTPGTTQGGAPGRTVDFPHVVTNDGTATDTIDLFFRTRLGFSVAIWSDPNGDGDPSDGALLGRDANGDGDMTDSGDTPPAPLADTNGNGFVDGGTLAAGASRSFVLRIGVPPRQAIGSEELVTLYAASGYKPSVRVQAEDRITVGLLTIAPSRNLISAPGTSTSLSHDLCNDGGAAAVVNLEHDSLLGWPATFWSDPNGDGDPSDGAPLGDSDSDGRQDLGLVPDATCVPFVLVVDVPAAAPIGIRDDIDISAEDGSNVATMFDTIRVVGATVEIRPDRAGRGQPGRTVFTVHEVINAGGETDDCNLSATSSLGSTVTVLDDRNDDGDPDGSVPVTSTGPLPPDGGRFPTITRIRIPGTATHGQVDTVRTRAASTVNGAEDTATDTISVHAMLTYSDALFARPATDFFGQCSTIYVLAFRTGGGPYRFLWTDPTGAVQRTSPDITAYSDGSLDDYFDGGSNPMLGVWRVRLQERQGGSNYVDVGPSGDITFEMRDLVSGGARVALNDTGSDLYDIAGSPLVAYADVVNPTAVDVMASRIEHVAFFDSNDDGVPTAGEDYVRLDGTMGAWSAGLLTSSRSGLDVYSGETIGDRFVTAPVTYSRPGRWTLRTTWVASCGFLIASRNVTFTIGCSPPPTFGGLVSAEDLDPCEPTGVRLDWDPVIDWGLGGTGTYAVYRSTDPGFSPDPSTLLVAGLTATSFDDLAVVTGQQYSYVVRAENSGNCSDGPNNFGLMDSNFIHAEVTDDDFGVIPVASFVFSGPACVRGGGASVDFTDTSAGPPWTWSWDFDGDLVEDSNDQHPTWIFPAAGDYTVTLVVESPCGIHSTSRVVTVGDPPVASAVASRPATCTDEPVDFDGSASTAVAPQVLVGWAWDFDGDGITDSTDADPGPVTYPAPGSYQATLTVTDSLGCQDVRVLDVVVHSELVVSLAATPVIDHCTGDVSVTAVASGGLAPYTYSWDVLTDDGSGTGTATFPFGTSRVANLTVTDAAGCSAVATTVDLAINPRLTLTLDPAVVEPCTGRVTVVARAAGGDGAHALTFTNLGPSGSAILAPGSYTELVTVTDGEGCVATASVDFDVPELVAGDFTSAVTYVGPDQFRAELSATATAGLPSFAFSWDLGGDGTEDGTGATFGFDMGAQETVVVDLTITDGNGCSVIVRREVISGGCPSDEPIRMVMVRKEGAGIRVSWDPSAHPCHDRYDVLVANTARPLNRPGTWPTDPAFTSVRLEDADGSPQDEQLTLADARPGTNLYILVRDGGTDGTWGPAESYGSTGVGP